MLQVGVVDPLLAGLPENFAYGRHLKIRPDLVIMAPLISAGTPRCEAGKSSIAFPGRSSRTGVRDCPNGKFFA